MKRERALYLTFSFNSEKEVMLFLSFKSFSFLSSNFGEIINQHSIKFVDSKQTHTETQFNGGKGEDVE